MSEPPLQQTRRAMQTELPSKRRTRLAKVS